MTRNINVLEELHEMFTAAGIEHRYTPGDTVITVIRRAHAWTVSEDHIIYWGYGTDVCKTRCRWGYGADVCKARCRWCDWTADAFDYISDVYSKAE